MVVVTLRLVAGEAGRLLRLVQRRCYELLHNVGAQELVMPALRVAIEQDPMEDQL